MSISIRKAGPEDAAALVGLIVALARYERLEHEVEASEADLASHLAEDANPRCEAFLAEDEGGRSVGFALFYSDYSTFLTGWGIFLEDLYVLEEYRGHGIGLALLSRLAAEAVDRGARRLNWQVLDWNETAINFYKALGARAMDDWRGMRLEGGELSEMAGRWPEARNRIART